MSYYRKLSTILSKKQMFQAWMVLIVIVTGSFIEMGSVYFIYKFIAGLLSPEATIKGDTLGPFSRFIGVNTGVELLIFLSFSIVVIYLFKGIWTILQNKISLKFIYNNRHRLSLKIFSTYMGKGYEYHRRKNTADLMRVITNDVTRFFEMLQNSIMLLSESFTVILLVALLFTISPVMTLITVLFIGGLMIFINISVSSTLSAIGKGFQRVNSGLYKSAIQAFSGIKEIKVNKREGSFVNTYSESSEELAKIKEKQEVIQVIPRTAIESITMMGIFAYIGIMLLKGSDVISQLPIIATFAAAAMRLMPSMNRINNSLNSVMFNKIALDTVYNDIVNENMDKNNEVNIDGEAWEFKNIAPIREGISVKNISYRFDDEEEFLFDRVNLFIPAMKSVAFVGTTGSGKTTMADLILGLLIPQRGEITFDGKNILENSKEWAATIGYIPQSIYLCDDTIRSNVAFGYHSCDVSDENVRNCLEQAQILDFVLGLKDGLDTVVGEGGVRLSGGQRQRIGIARALYNNPQFIVLDEATSALDNETEKSIIQTIGVLSKTKTLIIIAHRLTTIEGCDVIYRIEKGIISVEKGKELVEDRI